MNNHEIKNVYDGITPNDSQRERMLRNILRKKHRKLSKEFNPLPVAAMLTLIFCIWLVAGMDWQEGVPQGEITEPYGQTELTTPEETYDQAEVLELPNTAIKLSNSSVTFMEFPYYNRILLKYYNAMEEGWDVERCKAEGISPVFADHVRTQPETLCFSTPDLDGNGVEELVISDGTLVFDLYTVKDEKTKNLIQLAHPEDMIYLLEDGQFIELKSTDWQSYDKRYTRYGISEGGIYTWTVNTLFEKDGRWYQENGTVLDPDIDPINNSFVRKNMNATRFQEYQIAKGLMDWDYNQGKRILVTEDNFGLIYLPSQEDGTEATLQLLRCAFVEGDAYLSHWAQGDFSHEPLTLNHVQVDGKHVYFGTLVGTYPDSEGNDWPLSLCAGLFVTDSQGNTQRVIHNSFHELLLFVLDSPLTDFQLKVGDTVLQDHASHLEAGYEIREAELTPIVEDEDDGRIAQIEEEIAKIEEEIAKHQELLEQIQNAVQNNKA